MFLPSGMIQQQTQPTGDYVMEVTGLSNNTVREMGAVRKQSWSEHLPGFDGDDIR